MQINNTRLAEIQADDYHNDHHGSSNGSAPAVEFACAAPDSDTNVTAIIQVES